MNHELLQHFDRNEKMWEIWEQKGVNSETELTVNFHFYAVKKDRMQLLTQELESDEIVFRVKETRTLLFFKGWQIEADIKQKWDLILLQAKMGRMFLMAEQTGVSLEGCGAVMPK
ncbi:ribonuclease E inhibitor RraB [Flavobacterium psychroterrae]|uniref:Ribonuclease E inhibitor RraB n=1 Tax=Flavobacterium psychroterrae TaxID=2133767 RepID=A0ABS5P7E4_9FLAO|nr:ribonuclease E inhibitor RraB [Flavobacterium psychroterrae]MBS7230201.1 ribonuclease E inhibitor RraB [Flavobacterium psychroterrae]